MSKLRVHELARELNVESKLLMAKLKSSGAKVLSHQSTLTDQQVAELRGAFGGQAAAPSAAAPAADTAGGKPRVVIRRRAAVKEDSEDGQDYDQDRDAAQDGASDAHDDAPVEAATADEPEEAEEAVAAAPVEEPNAEAEPEVEAAPVAESPQPVEAPAPVAAAPVAAPPLAAPAPAAAPVATGNLRQSQSATIVRSAPPPPPPPVATRPPPIKTPLSRPNHAPGPQRSEASVSAGAGGGGDVAPRRDESRAPGPAPIASAERQAAAAPQSESPAQRAMTGLPQTGPRGAPPPAPAGAQPQDPAQVGSEMRRRRELGGATIVRRASPEEVEKLESANRSRLTGRKEDHRGTRVTGLGLLSNRVSAPDGSGPGGQNGPGGQGGQGGQGQSGTSGPPGEGGEDWNRRVGGTGAAMSAKDRKTQEEAEEQARKKAAAKSRRTNTAFNARTLLQEAEILTSEEEVQQSEFQGRTVYTPIAPRTKRDIKRRKDLKKTMVTTPRASYRVVSMSESITVAELAKQLAVKGTDLIKKLMTQGVMTTINQSIDFDTATLLASEYHFEVKSNLQTIDDFIEAEEDTEGHTTRPPIVTIMGHVDHGKTSLLDAIRKADVAGGEAGGITQHIGAYSVEHDGKRIAFLDTPGHEAFSSMRARGAKVTDIVVLVVAADDGVMPQTVEAINHAKAAGVPIIVAVNKIDKPQTNLDRVYTELTEHGIQAEEWGGEVQFIKTSAVKRTGINELLEAILLQAEVLDLKATSEGNASGAVIEGHLDKNRGPVATIMVQNGTLRPGDYIVAGVQYGRVRAMVDHLGKEVLEAGPSLPVQIIGLSGVPMAGDTFNTLENERSAREAADFRIEQARKSQSIKSSAASLADLLAKVKNSDVPEVPLILKGDTQGSIEAIGESIIKLSTDRVKNRIIHSAVGGVTESDIALAAVSGAMLIGFNVRAARGLDEEAERKGVVIKYFSVIYEIVDAVKAIMVGKLPPIVSELVLGHAEIRKTINVPKIGTIGGSAVLDGKITRASLCRLIRNNVVIYSGKLGSLRRFKDDVKEVVQGYECGIGIDGYADLKEGDVVEAYVLEETAATL